MMDPADRFYDAINRKDMTALADVVHPEFEMIVPQKPARGFVGKKQEVDNIVSLCESHPDLRMTVLRKVVNGNEIWAESHLVAPGLEMMAVVIWTVDPETATLKAGRYYSEPVQRDAADINTFMKSINEGA